MKKKPLSPRNEIDTGVATGEPQPSMRIPGAAVLMGLGLLAGGGSAHAQSAANEIDAIDDSYMMLLGATLTGLDVEDNDLLTFNGTPTPFGNTFTTLVSGPANAAAFNLLFDGTFTYTPAPGFVGTDSFVYRTRIDLGPTTLDEDTATVQIQVIDPAAPVAPPPAPAAVPTMGAGALAALASGLAFLGLRRRKRR